MAEIHDPYNFEWAEIRSDGTQWLNLEHRGWTRVSEIMRALDEVPKMWMIVTWAIAMSAAALTGIIITIALVLSS